MEIGKVIKSTGSRYIVKKENGTIVDCRIRGKFRMYGIRLTNPIAVGDIVEFDENEAIISKIHDRRNYIIRKSVNLSKEAHIIASNVDIAILIVTVNHPKTPTVFIDRFLVTAEAYNVPAVLVFNKIDLYDEDDMMFLANYKQVYENIGYPCLELSATTGENIDKLQELLHNKTSLFSGMSGVGKSSLINRIIPDLNLKTSTISDAYDSGKHTTTFAEMFTLDANSFIIDTRVRSFGIIDIKKEEISHYFPEIFEKSKECKFYNCTHTHEPSCAVIDAVAQGEISETRYVSYINLMEENADEKYR